MENDIFNHLIEKYISRYELLSHNGFYLVALSGGPDSVALLLLLKDLGYHIEAVHCNFHLRGAESDRDENFCIELCNKHGMALHRVHFDTMAYADLHHMSIEMAARELRYRYFEQLRTDLQADAICVAHHRDDQVETVLLHLIRGTGIKGLTGMKPKNGRIVRPFLGVSHQDILDYLSSRHQDYVIDSTNLERDAQRNQLRLDIIPLMEKMNSAAKANIARTATILSDIQSFTEQQLYTFATSIQRDGSYNFSAIQNNVHGKLVLWYILNDKGFNRQQLDEMYACTDTNKEWLSNHYVAFIEKDILHIISRDIWYAHLPSLRIPECGTYCYSFSDQESRKFRIQEITADSVTIDKRPQYAFLDADKITFPLTIRPTSQGDRFIPFGMKGSKLISDFMKDQKLSILQRKRQLIIADSQGKVIWIVGQRIDNRVAVSQTTKKMIVIELI